MKKYILLSLIAFTISAKAQVTLEHTYDSAGYFGGVNFIPQLYIINLEVDGDKFVFIDRDHKLVRFYNLNHTPWKSISYAAATIVDTTFNKVILYISQHLFNTNDSIEFLYVDEKYGSVTVTQVINEDGSIAFTANNQAPLVVGNVVPQAQLPIYNTSAGTKMILSGGGFTDGNAYVYSLAGTLSTDIQNGNLQMLQAQGAALSNLYPNPSNGTVTLQYELPKGETEGELILYNMQGAEVKRYKVDNTFKDVLIDNKQLQAGTYFYQLQTSKGAVGTKKMVVIK